MKHNKTKYRKLGKQFLEDNPYCILCGKIAVDVHHVEGRIGANYLDVSKWVPLCRECHYNLHFVNKREMEQKIKDVDANEKLVKELKDAKD